MSAFWEVKLRENHILRAALLPLLRIERMLTVKQYRKSNDSQYIKSLENSCFGERCFIIGNGPSLKKSDLELLRNEKTFAFNRIYSMYKYTNWRPTYYMAIDTSVLHEMCRQNKHLVEAEYIFLTNRKLVKWYKRQNRNAYRIVLDGEMPIRKERLALKKLSTDVSKYVSRPQSVTISAFEFAFYMGFKEIYLLGIDHSFAVEIDMKGNRSFNNKVESHFHEDEDKSPYSSNKESLTQNYEICKKYADRKGIKVVNVTRGGCLEVFERGILEEVLKV